MNEREERERERERERGREREILSDQKHLVNNIILCYMTLCY